MNDGIFSQVWEGFDVMGNKINVVLSQRQLSAVVSICSYAICRWTSWQHFCEAPRLKIILAEKKERHVVNFVSSKGMRDPSSENPTGGRNSATVTTVDLRYCPPHVGQTCATWHFIPNGPAFNLVYIISKTK